MLGPRDEFALITAITVEGPVGSKLRATAGCQRLGVASVCAWRLGNMLLGAAAGGSHCCAAKAPPLATRSAVSVSRPPRD
jgi:hypothetical protein